VRTASWLSGTIQVKKEFVVICLLLVVCGLLFVVCCCLLLLFFVFLSLLCCYCCVVLRVCCVCVRCMFVWFVQPLKGTLLHVVRAHKYAINKLQWIDSAFVLVTGSSDGRVKFWQFPGRDEEQKAS